MYEISDFDIVIDKLDIDIDIYLEIMELFYSEAAIKNILKQFTSLESYLYILYWLRFIKQLSYEDIGKNLGNIGDSHCYAYSKYLALGWNYSFNFKETEQIVLDRKLKLIKMREIGTTIDIKNCNLSSTQWIEYNTAFEKYHQNKVLLSTPVISKRGYDSFNRFFDALFYFTRIENLSSLEISLIIRSSHTQAQKILKKTYLLVDNKTAQKQTVKNNRRNYRHTLKTGNTTIRRNIILKGGTDIEVSVRNDFAIFLEAYIDKTNFEVIIGIANRSIISPKEVDIPIIIINKPTCKIFKFAVEVNGDIFHANKDRETIKKEQLIELGWTPFSIWQGGNKILQDNYGDIVEQIKDICHKIKIKITII